MNTKVKVICAGSGVTVQLTKAIRDSLNVETGDEVMLEIDGVKRGPFEVAKVPLTTLRLLRLHNEEDVYAFVPREINVPDNTEAILSVHELEADMPAETDGLGGDGSDEGESTDEAPSDEEREDTVTPAPADEESADEESDSGIAVAPVAVVRTKSKSQIISEIVAEAMPSEFNASEVVNEAANRGLEITRSYAAEVLRNIDSIEIVRGLTVGMPNTYKKVSS
jgi:hypothetical protein